MKSITYFCHSKEHRGWGLTGLAVCVLELCLFIGFASACARGEDSDGDTKVYVLEDSLGKLDPESRPSAFRFSADGKRVAQIVVHDDRSFVIVNDQKSQAYDGIVTDSLHFSPDGKHVGYGAILKNRNFVVVDGVEYPAFDASVEGMPIFSSDSQHFAYIAQRAGKYCVVLDGRVGPDFDLINKVGFGFSPDGHRFAYAAKEGEFAQIVLDEKPRAKFRNITMPTFSPDGKHFAYIAWSLTFMSVMLDGGEIYRTGTIVNGSLTFDGPAGLHVLVIDEGKIVRVRLEIGLTPTKP